MLVLVAVLRCGGMRGRAGPLVVLVRLLVPLVPVMVPAVLVRSTGRLLVLALVGRRCSGPKVGK